jgi:hypothetical protein
VAFPDCHRPAFLEFLWPLGQASLSNSRAWFAQIPGQLIR